MNHRFKIQISVTSRPPSTYEVDGEHCWFISHDEILAGIDRDEFLEVGRRNEDDYFELLRTDTDFQVRDEDSFLYGTTYQSIRAVISQSKLCLIDCNPEEGNCYVNMCLFQAKIYFKTFTF